MTLLYRLLAVLLVLGLQGGLAPHLAVDGISPDLPLVVVLVAALRSGPTTGGVAGLAYGAALDVLRGTRLGMFALAAGAAGWLCGEASSRVDPGRGSVRWVVATACAAVYGIGVAAIALLLDRNGVHATGVLRHAIGAAFYDGTLATVAYWVLGLRTHDPLPMGTRPLSGWRFPLGQRRRRRR